jgi:hypothetical protein
LFESLTTPLIDVFAAQKLTFSRPPPYIAFRPDEFPAAGHNLEKQVTCRRGVMEKKGNIVHLPSFNGQFFAASAH